VKAWICQLEIVGISVARNIFFKIAEFGDFWPKKWQFFATTPVLLHFYVVMYWSKIAKLPKLAILTIFWASKIAELAINRGVW